MFSFQRGVYFSAEGPPHSFGREAWPETVLADPAGPDLDAYLSPRLATVSPPTYKMLDLRPNCECCDRDLPPESVDALICTFECTFCRSCVEGRLNGVCPNCGGDFQPRPIRPARLLEDYPASTERILKPGCAEGT